MNVGVKNFTIMLSFDRTYVLDIAEIKLWTSKKYSLC